VGRAEVAVADVDPGTEMVLQADGLRSDQEQIFGSLQQTASQHRFGALYSLRASKSSVYSAILRQTHWRHLQQRQKRLPGAVQGICSGRHQDMLPRHLHHGCIEYVYLAQQF